jgi:hypothetical protein
VKYTYHAGGFIVGRGEHPTKEEATSHAKKTYGERAYAQVADSRSDRLDDCQSLMDNIISRLDSLESRTDPPVSENQRKAMHAAAAGKSTLGIPKSVGKEFAEADPGGKLPQSKSDAVDPRINAAILKLVADYKAGRISKEQYEKELAGFAKAAEMQLSGRSDSPLDRLEDFLGRIMDRTERFM